MKARITGGDSIEDGKIPQCRRCGGVMKPDVILPGEQLPAQMALKAKKLLHDCEAILAAGTSFSGGPVMNWIEQALGRGKNDDLQPAAHDFGSGCRNRDQG